MESKIEDIQTSAPSRKGPSWYNEAMDYDSRKKAMMERAEQRDRDVRSRVYGGGSTVDAPAIDTSAKAEAPVGDALPDLPIGDIPTSEGGESVDVTPVETAEPRTAVKQLPAHLRSQVSPEVATWLKSMGLMGDVG